MHKFLDSEGFKTRLIVSVLIFALLIPAYYCFDGVFLKWIVAFGIAMALVEYISIAFCSSFFPLGYDLLLTGFLVVTLIVPLLYLPTVNVFTLGTALVACASTDIFAYLFGNLIGGKIIKSRPFPKISPKKTWEGSLFGILAGCVAVYLWTGGMISYLWMPFIAFCGDLVESIYKRIYDVKDSNDFIVEYRIPVLSQIERLLGGRNGHGGFYDRVDSLSLVLMIQALVYLAP